MMPKSIDEIKEEIKEDIDEVVVSFKDYQKDGFNLGEIAKFVFEAGTKLMEAVESVQDITGAQKKEVVKSTIKDIYKKIDPDIPWIPEPFETMLENILLDKALDAFIDVIVAKFHEKGVFAHSG